MLKIFKVKFYKKTGKFFCYSLKLSCKDRKTRPNKNLCCLRQTAIVKI